MLNLAIEKISKGVSKTLSSIYITSSRGVCRFHLGKCLQLRLKNNSNFYVSPSLHLPISYAATRNYSQYIPPVPIPPVDTESVPAVLNALGEPTLSSLGLASMYPSGWIQSGLEAIHVGLGVPWWTSIVIGTLILRVATFPLVVISQKNSANLNNHMPVIQRLQAKFDKAKRANNSIEISKAARNLYDYMQANNVKPMRNMIVPFLQLPIFISVFMGIRQMANLPVQSMTSGGLSWFIDLTTPDPFFLLPIFTMATFFVTVEAGVDGLKTGAMSTKMKYFMRALPVVLFPFTLNFPAALLVYWLTSNVVSLVQVVTLKIKPIRSFLGIPAVLVHPKPPKTEKTPLLQEFKDSWKNSKTVVDFEERQRVEAIKFREAGMGAIPKTYSYDPTKKL